MDNFKLVVVLISIITFTSALEPSQESSKSKYDYDLIVIGGGSGGLAAAKDAYQKYHKRVLVIDFVKPSPQGTSWGVGGTCVNIGTAKKLFHHSSLTGEAIKEADTYGWEIKDPEKIKLNWATLIEAVQHHVKSTSWVLRKQLTGERKMVTDYINGLAEFVDGNTIKVTLRNVDDVDTSKLSDTTKLVTGEKILIAVGGRPNFPPIEGIKNLAITSDDLFSLQEPPGKTLILGAGFISLECAGFLRGMGYDVTIMERHDGSLKGLDKQMAKLVMEDLQSRGIHIVENTEVVLITEVFVRTNYLIKLFLQCFGKLSKKHKRYLRVKWKKQLGEGKFEEGEGLWETVLAATGRRAATEELKLENAKVEVQRNGKINATYEQTNIPNIYAVGDVLYEKPELTPVAVQAAKLLMDRLYGGKTVQMDYDMVAKAVYVPLEYGFVGLDEETAIEKHGLEKLEIYHQKFTPTEFAIPDKAKAKCYLKVICLKEGDQLIVGMHYFGPNAGEVMQGYATALKAGLTFKQLRRTTGVHPTASEEFTRVYITKSSGEDPTPQSCCN